ncbi:hypothetical protein HDU80_006170 [Chytriomyces hyalinus]|nr:hypothetical protein HDU80_006170 [Chytriomyces hyalinus]
MHPADLPLELQLEIALNLPIDRYLLHATAALPFFAGSMEFVQQHTKRAIQRAAIEWADWSLLPPSYRTALLVDERVWKHVKEASPELVNTAVRLAIIHKVTPTFAAYSMNSTETRVVSLLSWAASRGAEDAVRLLLRCGGLYKSVGEHSLLGVDATTLHAYPECSPKHDRNGALRNACMFGHANVVRILLDDERVDPNAPSLEEQLYGCHIQNVPSANLHIIDAARRGHVQVVELLLADQRRQGREQDALVRAAYAGHEHVVRALVKDPRVSTSCASSAVLRAACTGGNTQLVQFLLQEPEADVNAWVAVKAQFGGFYRIDSPLRNALFKGHEKVIELLKKDCRLDVTSPANSPVKQELDTKGHPIFEPQTRILKYLKSLTL